MNERRSLDDVILPMTMRATIGYGPLPTQPEPIDVPPPGMAAFPVMPSVLVPVDILCPNAPPGPGPALADEAGSRRPRWCPTDASPLAARLKRPTRSAWNSIIGTDTL